MPVVVWLVVGIMDLQLLLFVYMMHADFWLKFSVMSPIYVYVNIAVLDMNMTVWRMHVNLLIAHGILKWS